MDLEKKYNLLKSEVEIAENKRNFIRDSISWMNLRKLKKEKLAIRDSINKQ